MPNRELLERARMFEERAERATDLISRQHYERWQRTTGRYQSSRRPCGSLRRRTEHSHFRLIVVYFTEMHQTAFEPCIPSRGTKVPDRPEWIHELIHPRLGPPDHSQVAVPRSHKIKSEGHR